MTRNRFTLTALWAATLLAAGFAAPTSAKAGEDSKWYPAAICQQGGTSQGLDYYFGRVRNKTSAAVIADCPFVKDHKPGIFEKQSVARVIDRSTRQNVRCTLFSFDATSSTPSYNWLARDSSGYGSVVQTLTFSWGTRGVFTGGNLMMGCRIPPAHNPLVVDEILLYSARTAVQTTFNPLEYSELVGFRVDETDNLD